MTASVRPRRRQIILGLYLAMLVAACVWPLFGGSLLLLVGVVLAPPLVLLRSRMSLSASLALLFVAFAWAVLVVMVIARYTGVPVFAMVVAIGVLSGALCAVRLYRQESAFTRIDGADLGFAAFGGLVWCAVLVAAAVLPGGTPLAWSMSGDAANNVLFARELLQDGGVSIGGGQNPVPLTAALIAFFTLPATMAGAPSAGAQIVALAEMWSFGIVAACVLCGALGLAIARGRSTMTLIASAITSALPLTWIMLSGPVTLGFVNFHLTIALLAASLVTLVHSGRAVLTSLVTQSLAIALTLALWAPLAGIPGVALLILLVVQRKAVFGLRRSRLLVALAAIAQPLLVFALLSLPALIDHGGALEEALGAVFEFKKIIVVFAFLLAVAFGILHARATKSLDLVWVLTAVVGGGGLCLGVLLWLRRNQETLWSYYQLKFLWFLLAVLLIVGVAAGLTFAAAISKRSAWSALAFLAVLTTLVGVDESARATVPTFSNDPQVVKSPLVRVLSGDFWSMGEDDRVFDRVVELMDSPERTILWESGDADEDWIMFWVVQLSSTGVDDVELRKYAYYHDGQSMEDLCDVRRRIGAPVTVITADETIVERVNDACSDLGPVVFAP
ncbi:hypothetical protein [Microbacterium sp. CPCC 204701]|uniref:hypothetical protein n=1 Tax=Microbacterium sp. CPCC 204701 TaxID=2493084 RepID=UPI000FD7DB7C|nr:hypothetical protein [Microbacterium sp. CPCC 204701]